MNPEITITLPKDQYDDLLNRADIIKEIEKYSKGEKDNTLCIVTDERFYDSTYFYIGKEENMKEIKAEFTRLKSKLEQEEYRSLKLLSLKEYRNKIIRKERDELLGENKSLKTNLKKTQENEKINRNKWFIF